MKLPYAATKAFANTFSESLRGEVKKDGVHVTLLAPGPVRTELPDASERSLVEKLIPEFLWIDTEYTAKVSLDGLERNKMRVVPGVTSKAMSVASPARAALRRAYKLSVARRGVMPKVWASPPGSWVSVTSRR